MDAARRIERWPSTLPALPELRTDGGRSLVPLTLRRLRPTPPAMELARWGPR